jgi:predicted nucleotidyltransferase
MLNSDYRDMLCALSEEGVKFLLVGAYAMAAHGYPRSTVDMDLWVMPTQENAEAVLRGLARFGAPAGELTVQDLAADEVVFQIGVAPKRIDLLTTASGLSFVAAYSRSIPVDIDGVAVRVLCMDDLIVNKKTTGRTKDLADVEALEAMKSDDAGGAS